MMEVIKKIFSKNKIPSRKYLRHQQFFIQPLFSMLQKTNSCGPLKEIKCVFGKTQASRSQRTNFWSLRIWFTSFSPVPDKIR